MKDLLRSSVLKNAALLATLSVACALPLLSSQMDAASAKWLTGRISPFSPREAFAVQGAMMWIVAFSCCCFGLAWGGRGDCPGLGWTRISTRAGIESLGVGVAFGALAFALRAAGWRAGVESAIPANAQACLAEALAGATFYEIVARFGAISWLNRLLGSKTASVVLSALAFAFLGSRPDRWLGWQAQWPEGIRGLSVLMQGGVEFSLGALYVRYGLWSSCLAHGVIGLSGFALWRVHGA